MDPDEIGAYFNGLARFRHHANGVTLHLYECQHCHEVLPQQNFAHNCPILFFEHLAPCDLEVITYLKENLWVFQILYDVIIHEEQWNEEQWFSQKYGLTISIIICELIYIGFNMELEINTEFSRVINLEFRNGIECLHVHLCLECSAVLPLPGYPHFCPLNENRPNDIELGVLALLERYLRALSNQSNIFIHPC